MTGKGRYVAQNPEYRAIANTAPDPEGPPSPGAHPLQPLGLDPASEAVYRGLLAQPGEDPTALAERLGIPHAGLRRALDQLAELGLTGRSYDRAGQLRAVYPRLAWRS
jgi:hypothetical protein